MGESKDKVLDAAFNKSLQMAFPPVTIQLLKALLEPVPSFASIASYLAMDPMLTSRVLRIVNSSSYGFSQKITDIQRAAIAIGTSELFKLVISLSLQKRLRPIAWREPENVFADWRLTIWSSLASEAIAGRLCPDKQQAAYLAAILKDLPLFLAFCQEEAPAFLADLSMITLPSDELFTAEKLAWGQTHPEMTAEIILDWGLGDELAEAVRRHHDFDNTRNLPPLCQSLIYGTRWAELMYTDEPDPGRLIFFELELAAELGLGEEEMEKFRETCVSHFTLLLEQLGVKHVDSSLRLYDQSLRVVQHYHFLALEAFGSALPTSLGMLAQTLQRQLSTFWDMATWELYLSIPGTDQSSLFRCTDGALQPEMPVKPGKARPHKDWEVMPVASNNKQFGFLAVPPGISLDTGQISLPMFMHMLGIHLDGQRKQLIAAMLKEQSFADIPLPMAKLDKACRIKDATRHFLDLCTLSHVPAKVTARELLHTRLGISLPYWEDVVEDRTPFRAWMTTAPEGHFPGQPLYVSIRRDQDGQDDYYLLLGEMGTASRSQIMALTHPNFIESLFASISERVFMLYETGVIFWASSSHKGMEGKNIFALSKPSSSFRESWTPEFLKKLTGQQRVPVILLTDQNAKGPYELTFTPVTNMASRHYLLVVRDISVQQPTHGIQDPWLKDNLTGLITHSQFHLLLERESAKSRDKDAPIGILYCDIDNFRQVNALYGYQTGDSILRRVSGCLTAICRKGEDLPCRYGEDDFALLVPSATTEVMERIAAGLHAAVRKSCHGAITLNIGLALLRDGEAPEARIESAAKACKAAKNTPEKIRWTR